MDGWGVAAGDRLGCREAGALEGGLRRVECGLEVFDELGDVEAVSKGVMDVDGDGHGAAVIGFGDFAEGNAGS